MLPHIFIERSRLGKVIYELRDDRLSITGRRAMRDFRLELELNGMSSRIERGGRRYFRPILKLFTYAAVFATIAVLFLVQQRAPLAAIYYFVEFAAVCAVAFFMAGLKWVPRLEVVRFKDAIGRTLFDVVKEQAYAVEFEQFVQLLRDRIQASKGSANVPSPLPVDESREEKRDPNLRWIASLVFGLLAVALPWIGRSTGIFGDWNFPISFLCSVGGVGFSVYSFMRTERYRYFSVLGAVASIVPAFLF